MLPWAACLTLIDGMNVDGMITCENSNVINFGAGDCTIRASDSDMSQYLQYKAGDEIEIYMHDQQIANKVWGGYVENLKMSNSEGRLLEIRGKDYSSRLQNQVFTHSFTGEELSAAVTTILGYQTDFELDIAATSSKPVYADFVNESIFNALQKICNVYNFYFWVDVNKTCRIQDSAVATYSPDTIDAGVNATRKRYEQDNRQALTNKVTVIGSGGITQTAEDLTSQATYGIFSRQIAVASLNTAASVLAYANKYIELYKDPKPNQIIETKFLPYTDPREDVAVDIPDLGLVGDYTIVRHTRRWGKGQGLKSEVEMSNKITDVSLQLGQFERRIRDLEAA